MLTLAGISKSFGGQTLFEEVSLQFNRGDRFGLVGPNGAGKSTLFKVILGEEEADAGEIQQERNITIGFLPQESAPAGGETVIELATSVSPEFVQVRKWLADPEAFFRDHPSSLIDPHTRFRELRGFELEAKAKTILAGLAFRESDFDRPTGELSGGWVMRAHLARLLVQEPDLLMLDEPTNHLDLYSLNWFREYLKTYPGAILMISHDRDFLNQLVSGIVEIRQNRLFRYRGNYDEFLVQREASEAQLLAAYKNQQKEIEKLQLFVDRFRAKSSKAAQAQSKMKQIDRIEKIEAPTAERRKVNFSFPQPQRSGQRVIELIHVRHAYGNNVVYEDLEFEAERGQRIVLVGPNGAGKSTLLKLLAETLPVQQGERKLGHNVKAGYFSQYRVDQLTLENTVLAEALSVPHTMTEERVRSLLGCFLFTGDDVFKPVKVLSGGEKSRLALAKLLLDPPNLLLMDEPTTHLDIPSIDALVGALRQYEGTLIFISHDVHFIRELANHVVHVDTGVLRHFPGDYQYFLDKTAAEARKEAGTTSDGSPGGDKANKLSGKERRRMEAEARQARSGELKKLRETVTAHEKKIHDLEARQHELSVELEKPETYESAKAVQINRELLTIVDQLHQLNAKWEKAAEKLAQFEAATN
jgi:ATP-binding cassette, subfamily F, member 3